MAKYVSVGVSGYVASQTTLHKRSHGMIELNTDKIYRKFRDIRESTERLTAFRDITLDEFLNDRDKQDIASFRLIVATEAGINMCLHKLTTFLLIILIRPWFFWKEGVNAF